MAYEIDGAAREKLLDALASGASVIRAAEASGYHRSGIYKLLKEPAFVSQLERRRRGSASVDEEQGLEELRRLAAQAENETVRLGAAKALVELARKKNPALKASAPVPVKILPPLEAGKAADDWLAAQA